MHISQTSCQAVFAPCILPDQVVLSGLNLSFPVAQWSPDGEFIAVFMQAGWEIYRADCLLQTGHCPPVHRIEQTIDPRLAWGPDGSLLAYLVEPDNRFLQAQTRGCWDGSPPSACQVFTTALPASLYLYQPNWSGDGQMLIFNGFPANLYTLDIACLVSDRGCEGSVRQVSTGLHIQQWPLLSHDSTHIIYVSRLTQDSPEERFVAEQLFMLDVISGQRQQLTFREADSTLPDWSPDGRYLAFAGFPRRRDGNMNIYVLDMDRGLVQKIVDNPGRDMYPSWGRPG